MYREKIEQESHGHSGIMQSCGREKIQVYLLVVSLVYRTCPFCIRVTSYCSDPKENRIFIIFIKCLFGFLMKNAVYN